MRKKIFYIISGIQKSLSFEWTALALKNMYDITFVLLNPGNSSLEDFLNGQGVPVKRIQYRGKQDGPSAFIRLCLLFLKERPVIVHAHLFEASWFGLLAAWIVRVKKRIYTRHNSTFHHLYFPKAVKYDRLINRLATQIVSISQATDFVLLDLESVPKSKLRKIPHGFDLKAFSTVEENRIQAIKKKWRISDARPRIGVIARHIEWKGLQYTIPAFQKFLIDYPEACLILANASGPYHDKVVDLTKDIPHLNIIQVPFENDVAALYKLFDVYVHVPIDATCEAFGQTYVETMAAGIPSVLTLSGIAPEFVKDGVNALVVDFKNTEQIYSSLVRLWSDKSLRESIIEKGRTSVDPIYSLSGMVQNLRRMYDE